VILSIYDIGFVIQVRELMAKYLINIQTPGSYEDSEVDMKYDGNKLSQLREDHSRDMR